MLSRPNNQTPVGNRLSSDMSLAELADLFVYINSQEYQQRLASLKVRLAKRRDAGEQWDFEQVARDVARELQIPLDVATAGHRIGLEIYTAAAPASGGRH